VIWKFLGETRREVGEKMRGELSRRPIVLIAFFEPGLCTAQYPPPMESLSGP
jgi:hypothetical protein